MKKGGLSPFRKFITTIHHWDLRRKMKIKIQGTRKSEQLAKDVIDTLRMISTLYPEIDSYSDIELHITPLDGKGSPRRLVNEYGKDVTTYILKDPNKPKRARKRQT